MQDAPEDPSALELEAVYDNYGQSKNPGIGDLERVELTFKIHDWFDQAVARLWMTRGTTNIKNFVGIRSQMAIDITWA